MSSSSTMSSTSTMSTASTMTSSTVFLPVLVALIAALLLSLQGRRWRTANESLNGAKATLQSLGDDARAVLQLRGTAATTNDSERPTADVIAIVNRVLTGAGVPTTRFAGCKSEGDAPVPGSNDLRRQSVRLNLQAMTAADIGSFLGAWRSEETVWTPTSIEMNHAGDDQSQTFDVQVVLSAVYHGVPGGSPR